MDVEALAGIKDKLLDGDEKGEWQKTELIDMYRHRQGAGAQATNMNPEEFLSAYDIKEYLTKADPSNDRLERTIHATLREDKGKNAKQINKRARILAVVDPIRIMDPADPAWCRQELILKTAWGPDAEWPLATTTETRQYTEEYRTFVEDISGEDLCDASALEILEVAKRVDALSVANAQTRLRLHTLPMCTHSNPTADAPALGPGDISYSNDDTDPTVDEQIQQADLPDVVSFDREKNRLGYSDTKIKVMSTWLKRKINESGELVLTKNRIRVKPYESLGLMQRIAARIIRAAHESGKQLMMTVAGGAGTGKSTLIHFITKDAEDENGIKSMVLSFTGVAAGLLAGRTIHSAFQLPVCEKASSTTQAPKKMTKFESDWENVAMIIVDEYSQLGHRLFARVDMRLDRYLVNKEKEDTELFMGGITSIITGDVEGQLDPIIAAAALHKRPPGSKAQTNEPPAPDARDGAHTTYEHKRGYHVVSKHSTVIQLDVQRRQSSSASVPLQRKLLRFLHNLRFGQNDMEDWEFSQSDDMQLSKQSLEIQIMVASWPRLFLGWKGPGLANEYNAEENKRLGVPLVHIAAQVTGPKRLLTATAQEFGGIPPSVTLGIGTRVMSTKNTWTNAGITNGLTGTVVGILFSTTNGTDMPEVVLVQWDEQYAGPSMTDKMDRIVPVTPAQERHSTNQNWWRTGYALLVCFGISATKAQGMTIPKVVVNLNFKGPDDIPTFAAIEYTATTRCVEAGANGMLFGTSFPPQKIVGLRWDHRRRKNYDQRQEFVKKLHTNHIRTLNDHRDIVDECCREMGDPTIHDTDMVKARATATYEQNAALSRRVLSNVHYMFVGFEVLSNIRNGMRSMGRSKTVHIVRLKDAAFFDRREQGPLRKKREPSSIKVGDCIFICCKKAAEAVYVNTISVQPASKIPKELFHGHNPIFATAEEAQMHFMNPSKGGMDKHFTRANNPKEKALCVTFRRAMTSNTRENTLYGRTKFAKSIAEAADERLAQPTPTNMPQICRRRNMMTSDAGVTGSDPDLQGTKEKLTDLQIVT